MHKTFGRCLSKEEAGEIRQNHALVGASGLVPVFDCPTTIKDRLAIMNRDRRRGIFRSIGVRDPKTIILFEIEEDQAIGPIPQKNGLMEYKVPSGTPVQYLGKFAC